MRQKILGAALGLAVLAAAFAAGAYEVITVTDGGSLSGTVKYAGTPPGAGEVRGDEGQRGLRRRRRPTRSSSSARAAASRTSPSS